MRERGSDVRQSVVESGNRGRKMQPGKLDNLIKTMLITLSNDGNLKAEGGLGIKGDIRGLKLC